MDAAEAGADATAPGSYRHDADLVPTLADLVDRACARVERVLQASVQVRQLAGELSLPVDAAAVREAAHTFAYLLKPSGNEARPGNSLIPEDGPSLAPRALRDADEEVRRLWMDLANTVVHPIARARCWDIVFTLGLTRNKRDSAERAARAYVDTVGGNLDIREQGEALLRALTLTRSVGLSSLEHEVSAVAFEVIEDVLARNDDPYSVVPLLEALTAPQRNNPDVARQDRANKLLDRALLTFSELHVVRDVAALIRKRSSGDTTRIDHASRVEIAAILAEADAARETLVAMFFLNQAASTARQLGVVDLADTATSRLQVLPPVKMSTIKREFSIPALVAHAFMSPYRYAKEWRTALLAWCCTDAPSGEFTANMAYARKSATNSAIMTAVTRMSIDEKTNMTTRVTSGMDSAVSRELVSIESFRMSVRGHHLSDALNIVGDRFGIPARGDLEDFFVDTGSGRSLARVLAEAFQLYWVGQHTACVHLAAPKVESVARGLLLELNEPVYRTAVGDSPGQFAGLGALLPDLVENGFDPDWERFLRTLLLGEGANVRNLVAHGFMDEVDRDKAALVLRALVCVALITEDGAVRRDGAAVRAALAQPVNHGRRRALWRRVIGALEVAWWELRRP